MKLIEVKSVTDIKKGDMVIVSGSGMTMETFKVPMVKVSHLDGTEVILNKRKNQYFNVEMYLKGKSWVKEIVIVK